jgi:hypothetical protein
MGPLTSWCPEANWSDVRHGSIDAPHLKTSTRRSPAATATLSGTVTLTRSSRGWFSSLGRLRNDSRDSVCRFSDMTDATCARLTWTAQREIRPAERVWRGTGGMLAVGITDLHGRPEPHQKHGQVGVEGLSRNHFSATLTPRGEASPTSGSPPWSAS